MNDVVTIFDRRTVRRHRDRAAVKIADHDFLLDAVAVRMAERLEDVTRDFPLALELGGRGGLVSRRAGPASGVGAWVHCDLSPAMAALSTAPSLAADEEFLPFADGVFDLVASPLSLHWVNDLPGSLIQIRRGLKPDSLFLATLFGTETLRELRQCLAEAEIAEEGGMSPRVSPLVDVKTAGALLQRAGFVGAIADGEIITVNYRDPLRLLADLRGMGESNAVAERRKPFTRRATLFEALRRYRENFAVEGGEAVSATFEIVTLTAWSPEVY